MLKLQQQIQQRRTPVLLRMLFIDANIDAEATAMQADTAETNARIAADIFTAELQQMLQHDAECSSCCRGQEADTAETNARIAADDVLQLADAEAAADKQRLRIMLRSSLILMMKSQPVLLRILRSSLTLMLKLKCSSRYSRDVLLRILRSNIDDEANIADATNIDAADDVLRQPVLLQMLRCNLTSL